MVAEFPFHRPRVIICAVTASPTPRLQLKIKIKAEDKIIKPEEKKYKPEEKIIKRWKMSEKKKS